MVQVSLADFYISSSCVGIEFLAIRTVSEDEEEETIPGRCLLGLQVDLEESQVFLDLLFVTIPLRG